MSVCTTALLCGFVRVYVCQMLLAQTVVSKCSISGEIRANHSLLKHLSINTVDHCTQGNLQLFSSACVYSVCWFCVTMLGKVSHELLRLCFHMKSLLKSIHLCIISKQRIITNGIETLTNTESWHFSHSGLGYPQLWKETNFTQSPWPLQNAVENVADKQSVVQWSGCRISPNLTQWSEYTVGVQGFLYHCLSYSSICPFFILLEKWHMKNSLVYSNGLGSYFCRFDCHLILDVITRNSSL